MQVHAVCMHRTVHSVRGVGAERAFSPSVRCLNAHAQPPELREFKDACRLSCCASAPSQRRCVPRMGGRMMNHRLRPRACKAGRDLSNARCAWQAGAPAGQRRGHRSMVQYVLAAECHAALPPCSWHACASHARGAARPWRLSEQHGAAPGPCPCGGGQAFQFALPTCRGWSEGSGLYCSCVCDTLPGGGMAMMGKHHYTTVCCRAGASGGHSHSSGKVACLHDHDQFTI